MEWEILDLELQKIGRGYGWNGKFWICNRRKARKITAEIGDSGKVTVENRSRLRLKPESLEAEPDYPGEGLGNVGELYVPGYRHQLFSHCTVNISYY